jgi:large subunit ribosomal protein L13
LGDEVQQTNKPATIIDADGLILGRMASKIAKRLLMGEEIIIVNTEKAVISGRKRNKVTEAKEFLGVGGVGRGPFHYRRPDRVVRKAVKGMLPVKQPKGKQAYKRLTTCIGVPNEFKNQKMETISDAQAEKLKCPYLTVGEFAKEIGWNHGE